MIRSKTILLADDDLDFIESMNAFLTEHGYNVITAQNGEEAVQKILQYEIDVLVLDIRLPIVDGVGVYIDINMHEKHIPTIISTAYSTREIDQIDSILSKAPVRTLIKPYDPHELLKIIEELL